MSPARALRRALAWVADELWGLALVCQGIQSEVVDQDGAPETLNPREVLIVLDGPDGAVGMASIEPALLAGLVERQTLGTVLPTPVADRRFTPTDAAMAAPLIDVAMQRFSSNLDGHPLVDQLSGFRFGAMIEDPRAASLVLDAAEYRVFRVTIDLAHGAKRGELQFMLPIRDVSHVAEVVDDDTPGPHEQTFRLVPAQINAILARVQMPLARASALKPGDLIPLSADAAGRVQIMVGQNEMLARASLGQMNGFRAVRLDLPDRPGRVLIDASPSPQAQVPAMASIVQADPVENTSLPASTVDLDPPIEAEAEFDAGSVDLPDLEMGEFAPAELPDIPDWDIET